MGITILLNRSTFLILIILRDYIMNEYKKLDEAKHFLDEMLKIKNDQKLFEYNVSACLSAARSVLQYAFEEVTLNGKQNWYNSLINASALIKYFRDKRNINIHQKPLDTKKRHELTFTTTMRSSVEFEIRDKDGNVISQSPKPTLPEANNQNKTTYDFNYIFDDWNGSENVCVLVEKYLKELELLIIDGVKLKNISG